MRSLIPFFIATFGGCAALANPIAIDFERRPVTMLSERVDVAVGSGKSRVNGEFRFQQDPPFEKEQTHVTIFVPVLLPDPLGTREYNALYGSPRVEISGRRFSAVAWNDLQLGDSPESVRLPRGWRMQLFVCKVPLRVVGGSFDAKISYMQPHFPNEVSAYIPIRPPRDGNSSQVTFSAAPGRKLRPVSRLPFFSSKSETLQFTPRDRKLIRVQLLGVPDHALKRPFEFAQGR